MDKQTIASALGALRLKKQAQEQPEAEEPKDTSGAGEFFGMLFAARDRLHLDHLATKSYARHMALNEAYDALLGLTDVVIESYQGLHGLVKISIPATSSDESSSEEFLRSLVEQVNAQREKFKDPCIQNQLDEISAAAASTIYKLENLK